MPKYYVLIGPPGAGKGTQAQRISKALDLPHISSGDLFRENLKKETELGKKAKSFMDRGELVPDDLTISMVRERLAEPDCKNGALLDGFPRTPAEAQSLSETLGSFEGQVNAVPYIKVADEVLVNCLTGRWTCRAEGHVYHEKFNPPKKAGVCDVDGSALYQREDDQPETVLNRIKVYFKQTMPLIDFYSTAGLLLEVDGAMPIDDVTAALLKGLSEEDKILVSWDRTIDIKSSTELNLMREAGRVNALALKAVRGAIEPGITTAELDAIVEEVIRNSGGIPIFKGYPGPYPYPATLNVSVNEELVHGIPGKRMLNEGDIVSVDCGTLLEGFVGDSAFSVGVGEISTQAMKLLDVTEQALYKGISMMRPGNRTGDISAAVQSCVESSGFYVTREYTGHGVGRNMHEGPQVPNYGEPHKGVLLRPGMTIALEPMVLVGTPKTRVLADRWTVVSADGSLTAHFEHSVAVTETDPWILTEL